MTQFHGIWHEKFDLKYVGGILELRKIDFRRLKGKFDVKKAKFRRLIARMPLLAYFDF